MPQYQVHIINLTYFSFSCLSFYTTVLDITARYQAKEVDITNKSNNALLSYKKLTTFAKRHKKPGFITSN